MRLPLLVAVAALSLPHLAFADDTGYGYNDNDNDNGTETDAGSASETEATSSSDSASEYGETSATGFSTEDLPRPTVGAHLGFNFDTEGLILGGQGRIPFGKIADNIGLVGIPVLEYYVEDLITILGFEANVAGTYGLGAQSPVEPYAGLGLSIIHGSFAGFSDTDLGINVFGGATFLPGQPIQPYAELRFRLGGGALDASPSILAGVSFAL